MKTPPTPPHPALNPELTGTRLPQAGGPEKAFPTRTSSPTCWPRSSAQARECSPTPARNARIPEPLVLETYPFERQPKLNKKRRLALYDSLGYMRQHQNLIGMGITGCGKTGLATRFLIHAIDHGYRGRYVLFADLVGELYHAQSPTIQPKSSNPRLGSSVIDEMGYQVEPCRSPVFFTLMHQRHKTKSTLITSNLGFAQWGSFLKNDMPDRPPSSTGSPKTSHVINLRDCVGIRPKLPSEPVTFWQCKAAARACGPSPWNGCCRCAALNPTALNRRNVDTLAGVLLVTGGSMQLEPRRGRRRGHRRGDPFLYHLDFKAAVRFSL